MSEEAFWSTVEAAKRAAGTKVEARIDALTRQLSSLDPKAIQAFQRHYDQAIARAYRWDLWGAAYVMNGGCSDDCFRYFRDWLVSEGRERYERALSDPDSLAEVQRRDYFELESYGYAALEAYEAKSRQEMERDGAGEPRQPAGKPWKESELRALFPKLAAKYLGK